MLWYHKNCRNNSINKPHCWTTLWNKLIDGLVDTSAVRTGCVRERHVGASIYPESVWTSPVAIVPDESRCLAITSAGYVIDRKVGGRLLLLMARRLTLVTSSEQVRCGRMLLIMMMLMLILSVGAICGAGGGGGVIPILVVRFETVTRRVLLRSRMAQAGNGGHYRARRFRIGPERANYRAGHRRLALVVLAHRGRFAPK